MDSALYTSDNFMARRGPLFNADGAGGAGGDGGGDGAGGGDGSGGGDDGGSSDEPAFGTPEFITKLSASLAADLKGGDKGGDGGDDSGKDDGDDKGGDGGDDKDGDKGDDESTPETLRIKALSSELELTNNALLKALPDAVRKAVEQQGAKTPEDRSKAIRLALSLMGEIGGADSLDQGRGGSTRQRTTAPKKINSLDAMTENAIKLFKQRQES